MSPLASAILVTGIFVVGGLVLLAATAGWLDPRDRKTLARRFGWILLGTAGMPALLVGLVYLIGIPIAVAAIVFGRVVANVEGVLRALFALSGLVFLWGVATVAVNYPTHPDRWIAGVTVAFSVLAALISLSKLGMMIGRRREVAI